MISTLERKIREKTKLCYCTRHDRKGFQIVLYNQVTLWWILWAYKIEMAKDAIDNYINHTVNELHKSLNLKKKCWGFDETLTSKILSWQISKAETWWQHRKSRPTDLRLQKQCGAWLLSQSFLLLKKRHRTECCILACLNGLVYMRVYLFSPALFRKLSKQSPTGRGETLASAS